MYPASIVWFGACHDVVVLTNCVKIEAVHRRTFPLSGLPMLSYCEEQPGRACRFCEEAVPKVDHLLVPVVSGGCLTGVLVAAFQPSELAAETEFASAFLESLEDSVGGPPYINVRLEGNGVELYEGDLASQSAHEIKEWLDAWWSDAVPFGRLTSVDTPECVGLSNVRLKARDAKLFEEFVTHAFSHRRIR